MTKYFASLDASNTVVNVECLDEENCLGPTGAFSEPIAVAYLQEVFGGGIYIETRDEVGFRGGRQALSGDTWDPEADRFFPKRPTDDSVWSDEIDAWITPDPGTV